MARRKRSAPMKWHRAPDIEDRINILVRNLEIGWVDPEKIHGFRSENSSSRAIARIWGLNKVWQMALELGPTYIIEVIAERFDDLPQHKKDEVLLHEIAHIPKNFSGALVAHSHKGKSSFHEKLNQMIARYYGR